MLEKGWGGGTHKSEIRVREILVCWEMTASQDVGFSILKLYQNSLLCPFSGRTAYSGPLSGVWDQEIK